MTILKNDGVRQWGWDYPMYEMEKMLQTTKQVWFASPCRFLNIVSTWGSFLVLGKGRRLQLEVDWENKEI